MSTHASLLWLTWFVWLHEQHGNWRFQWWKWWQHCQGDESILLSIFLFHLCTLCLLIWSLYKGWAQLQSFDCGLTCLLYSGKSNQKEKKPWGNTNHWYCSVLHQDLKTWWTIELACSGSVGLLPPYPWHGPTFSLNNFPWVLDESLLFSKNSTFTRLSFGKGEISISCKEIGESVHANETTGLASYTALILHSTLQGVLWTGSPKWSLEASMQFQDGLNSKLACTEG